MVPERPHRVVLWETDPMKSALDTSRRDQALSFNMRLLAHHDLSGFGGIGEGMALQVARDGRRILWLAHESAPKNFTGVDVSDPRAPKIVVQTELPHAKVRSNSLDVVGDVMAVAYQTQTTGLTPAGFELFDIRVPEQPNLIAHFDASGPHSRGVRGSVTSTPVKFFGADSCASHRMRRPSRASCIAIPSPIPPKPSSSW